MGRRHDEVPEGQPDIVQRTFVFGEWVNRLCRHLLHELRDEQDLARQLKRSGRVVGALVEEAQGGETRKDFIHKMSIAHKEARESHYWLRQLIKADVMPSKRLIPLNDEAFQIKLILAAIINSTKRGENDSGEDQPSEGDQNQDDPNQDDPKAQDDQ
ncbi:MAG: four helix bundle protein [Planctomycetota bacterium]|nr:four helix bundle protein [Planctomycetota bacterium]